MMWDIAQWDNEPPYMWIGWALLEFLVDLDHEKRKFLDCLSGIASVARGEKYRCGWGIIGLYTSAEGYRVYSKVPSAANNPSIWKNLWEDPMLQKIDIFCWTMVHGRILTGQNLEKCGIEGPFRCPLCRVNSETIMHLFFIFPYARDVWDHLTIPWFDKIELPGNAQNWFVNWEKEYKGDLVKKKESQNVG